MQPTEIFTKTVKTGIPVTKGITPDEPQNKEHFTINSRDVVKVDIKLLLHWASRQLDQCTIRKESRN